MAESLDTTQNDSQAPEFDDSLPEGSHAVEVAARAGFGPLSPLAEEAWHGQSVPCVSCGQLVRRDATGCEHCGQDLAEDMVQKMRQHAGPWFVLEHVRPFPGVSLDRIIRQIRRGLITETSIVRGPSNDYQWRFAVETPGLCRYFGKCWCCHAEVTLSDAYCAHCLHYLSFEKPRATLQVPGSAEPRPADAAAIPAQTSVASHYSAQAVATASPTRPASVPIDNRKSTIANSQVAHRPVAIGNPPTSQPTQSPDLARLSAAVRQSRVSHKDSEWDAPPRVGGVNVAWIAALLIVAAIVALLLISRARSDRPAAQTGPSLPTMPAPVVPQRPVPTSGAAIQPPPTTPQPAVAPPTGGATQPASTPPQEPIKPMPPPGIP